MQRIYLDYASTTPVDPAVAAAMEPFLTDTFGNAASLHSFGREAQKALEDSREIVGKFLGGGREEIIFTSGGTEANNMALIGLFRSHKGRKNHLIISKIEHPSVLETARFLESEGCAVTYADVQPDGTVDLEQLKKAINEHTFAISIQHASNEIGTIQPMAEIARLAKEREIIFHTDAVQTAGHIPVSISPGIDLLTLSAHKFYGPKGIGALYVKKGVTISPYLFGGNQENGLRPSTQNVAAAVGMAKALQICSRRMSQETETTLKLRGHIIAEVLKNIPGSRLNGHPSNRLPNNAHFCFEGIKSEMLLLNLDMAGIAVSKGSACKAGSKQPSHVLKAIGLSDSWTDGALRVSLGRSTSAEHIEYFLNQLKETIAKLRKT